MSSATTDRFDPVAKPKHYNSGEIECVDAIRSALGEIGFRSFCQGNVIKYAWRAMLKGREEDFRKAAWYAHMASGDDPRADRKQQGQRAADGET